MPQLLLELAPPPAPSFANFMAGVNAAAVAALRVFGTPDADDRVMYLWGSTGSGRSHLLAAWLGARSSAPDPLVTHTIADDVESLDDDAQIKLFNRINDARAGTGYVLAAGTAQPRNLALRPDLKSRLAWGLAFEIRTLTDHDKRAALLHQATARGMSMNSELLDYLMTYVRRDMPTLTGIVDALDRYSLETKRPVTLPLVRELLAQTRTLDL